MSDKQWDLDTQIEAYKVSLQQKQVQLEQFRNAIANTQREIDVLTGIIRGMQEVKDNGSADGE